jgi:cytochrome c oxidase cbb3-type subunit III
MKLTPSFAATLIGVASLVAQAPQRPAGAAQMGRARVQLPDAPGRDTVQKVCGVCHGADVTVQKGMTRQEWGQVIATMVTRGAKATDEEFARVLDYLSTNFPPANASAPGPVGAGANRAGANPAPRRGGGGGMGFGANDKHEVDSAAADRGRTTYIAECITCHGPKARGTDNGADLVRSATVLRDRYADNIGPFLRKGHPTQSGKASSSLTPSQVADLSHFLHQKVYDTLRSGPYSKVINVLTGDATAGQVYFNGAGACKTCHSPTGDLAGIGKKYDPPTLQQRFVFPQSVGFGRAGAGVIKTKPVTVTVTPPSGPAISGVLVSLDDFNVALRDASGEYHSWKRTSDLKVEKSNPYDAHIALLDHSTDKNIHDVVAYLETLK